MTEQQLPPWAQACYTSRSLYVQGTVHLEDFLPTHEGRIRKMRLLLYPFASADEIQEEEVEVLCRLLDKINPRTNDLGNGNFYCYDFGDTFPQVSFPPEVDMEKLTAAYHAFACTEALEPLFDLYLIDSRQHSDAALVAINEAGWGTCFVIADRAPACNSSKKLREELCALEKKHGNQEPLCFGSYARTLWEVM